MINRTAHPLVAKCDQPNCNQPYYEETEEGDYLCRKHWYSYIEQQLANNKESFK